MINLKPIVIKKGSVLAEAYLSSSGMGHFNVEEEPFTCGFSVDILTDYYDSTPVKSNAEGEPIHASA
jgi:hypothetical protein